ncbi:MAG: dipeptidyl peptidase 3 [Cytophagales bacterium]|nr:dipeptidyl peptidase 3 [Cytophagales bacterium]
MKKLIKGFLCLTAIFLFQTCRQSPREQPLQDKSTDHGFEYVMDRFADLQILKYRVPGFDELDLEKKKLAYYLYQAALSGRDMIYDQNYKHNLRIRKTIEAIYNTYTGAKSGADWEQFEVYAKRVWFSGGIHHHYATTKFIPGFSEGYFSELVMNSAEDTLPLQGLEDKSGLIALLAPVIFDPAKDAKRINLESGQDLIRTSANNYYEGLTQAEAQAYYQSLKIEGDKTPLMYGLNSKLIKENGQIVEKVYKVGGLYTEAIERIVFWLEKAVEVAENDAQKKALELLVKYYNTGDLKDFDEYCKAWVVDTESRIDVVNGFIEVYGDPLGFKGAYESVVSMKDMEATDRMAALAKEAKWFEANSPIMDAHRKEDVKGISYKVITVIVEGGDAAPSTPIGINLPNSNWIRKDYGSKSVSLGNIVEAYNAASSGGSVDEFYYTEEERKRVRAHGKLAGKMHTALHEVIGHGSGQLENGIATPSETLKNYRSPLEEARADLVSLYYITDPKLVELGLLPTTEVGKAEYDTYIKNGLQLQLRRLEPGSNIEQAHMRNRHMVASWVYEKGKKDNVIEKVVENGKTYFVIRDYEKLRGLFGQLLREVQRIKSQGDYEAGKNLIEHYGIIVDQNMLNEVKERYARLNAAPYSGFVQPRLVAQMNGDEITDVTLEYPETFVEQMLEYGREYAFLPY